MRSAHNVGAILRVASGVAAKLVIVIGITPHPRLPNDLRPDKIINSNQKAITKTALGAETEIPIEYYQTLTQAIDSLRAQRYTVVGFENRGKVVDLFDWQPKPKTAIVLGSEVQGLDPVIMMSLDQIIKIPMLGQKESLNVAVVAGIAGYQYLGGI